MMGVCLSAFFYGFGFVQLCQYGWRLFRRSLPLSTRGLVAWTFLVDTVHTACLWWMSWVYTVDNFGNVAHLLHIPWPAIATPLFICMISGPIQLYHGYQFSAHFSAPRTLCWTIFALGLGNILMGIAAFVFAATRSLLNFEVLVPLVAPWLSVSILCDFIISGSLAYYLPRNGQGFSRHRRLWRRVVAFLIDTSLFTPLWLLTDLLLYVGIPHASYHIVLGIPMGRVYTSCLLTKLNAHLKQREDEVDGVSSSLDDTQSQPHSERRLPFASPRSDSLWFPTEIRVDVTYGQQVDIPLDDLSSGTDSKSQASTCMPDQKSSG
ncbi:hypothetical protein C8Q76DRAFT_789817 [Earliella scabrosa]|nr:hypothetical protein C8Q76DRAFT_789817 [Earliella scabrosa]